MSITDKQIENYLKEHFEDRFIYKNETPLKNSVHCVDYVINNVEVRCRFFSPSRYGEKGAITYHLVTPEQKKEKDAIETEFKVKEMRRQRDIKRMQEWNTNRILGYTNKPVEKDRFDRIDDILNSL